MPVVAMAIVAVAAAAIAGYLVVIRARRQSREIVATARVEAKAAKRRAELDANSVKRTAETEGREAALEVGAIADAKLGDLVESIARREEQMAGRDKEIASNHADLDQRWDELKARDNEVKSLKDRARGLRKDVERRGVEEIEKLAEKAGESKQAVLDRLENTWLEDARAQAAHAVRLIEQRANDSETGREAQRVMNIAVSRYRNHFLTVKGISNIRIGDGVADVLTAADNHLLDNLQEVANIKIHLAETGDSVRLEGLDGVGREVARRALSRLTKKPESAKQAQDDPVAWITKIREQLDREIVGLGRKAFSVLKVQRAHPEICDLVGALNYRTSYTQNQWLHAVEASFLAGMMADELGLDARLARRATLMHDIGKALTHEIEGSHAVIGADIARRLGEDEIIANAIGSHHADEPPNSVYAFLVAGADAMSGARPGARREHTDGYSTKLEDLERIGASYRGVDRCFAVHGGRELRLYVVESQVTDLEAIELSSEVAGQISDEMTFPGQIKVTVIRQTEAVEVAN